VRRLHFPLPVTCPGRIVVHYPFWFERGSRPRPWASAPRSPRTVVGTNHEGRSLARGALRRGLLRRSRG
jgi:hypothetical protein